MAKHRAEHRAKRKTGRRAGPRRGRSRVPVVVLLVAGAAVRRSSPLT